MQAIAQALVTNSALQYIGLMGMLFLNTTSSLYLLYFEETRIGDNGAYSVALILRQNSSLQHIDLRGMAVTILFLPYLYSQSRSTKY